MNLERLEQAAAQAVAHGHAQTIVLFGSRARHSAGSESDWDVCLIANDTDPRRIKALVNDHPIWGSNAIETLWTTREDLCEQAHEGTVYADIVREGRLPSGDRTMLQSIEIKPFKSAHVVDDIRIAVYRDSVLRPRNLGAERQGQHGRNAST